MAMAMPQTVEMQSNPTLHNQDEELKEQQVFAQSYAIMPSQRLPNVEVSSVQTKRVNDLSRNMLVIVCEYLTFFEIIELIKASKKILTKLDDFSFESQLYLMISEDHKQGESSESVSYLKRRGTLFFQNFFFQQFPSSDIFLRRMTSLTTTSYVAQSGDPRSNRDSKASSLFDQLKTSNFDTDQIKGSQIPTSSFLPFVKQSSILEEKQHNLRSSMAPTQNLMKDGGSDPFNDPLCQRLNVPRDSTITTNFTENGDLNSEKGDLMRISASEDAFSSASEIKKKPINSYINKTYDQWKSMYLRALNFKKSFTQTHSMDFYTAFVQTPNDYAREIYLDPAHCENPCFALPQLTRENYNERGLFYRTEKVLVQNFSSCFQKYSVDYTKQMLWNLNQRLQNEISKTQHAREVLNDLIFSENFENQGLSSLNAEVQISQPPKFTIEAKDFNEPLTSLPPFKPLDLKILPKIEKFPVESKGFQMSPLPQMTSLPNLSFLGKQNAFEEEQDLELPSLMMPSLQKSVGTQAFNFNPPPQLPDLSKVSIPKDFSLPTDLLLPCLQKNSEPNLHFELIGLDQHNRIVAGSDDISVLYKNIASYTLKQFYLICSAHRDQLNFILEQIKMAPAIKKNFFMYLEDYVQKERNLRILLRKISQNFIMQEAFQETLLRNDIFQARETKKQPYLCDFVLLEFLDSIWINQIFRAHRENLVLFVKQAISELHNIDRFEELAEKKETIRKVVNLINQTDFNLINNKDFLSISRKKFDNSLDHEISVDQIDPTSSYDSLKAHMQGAVRFLLKQMQRKSQSIQEFMEMCSTYEQFNFQKLQEVEYFYIQTKKYYLTKSFAKELSNKLESSKFARPSFGGLTHQREELGITMSGASASTAGSDSSSRSPVSSSYQNLNLNTAIHYELVNTFFHQLLRSLIKDDDFTKFIQPDQLLQSLFVLFQIEPATKSQFAADFNSVLTQMHSEIDELLQQQPELLQSASVSAAQSKPDFGEESKNMPGENEGLKVQEKSLMEKKGPSIDTQCPFIVSDEDEEELMMEAVAPVLNRGFSEQKKFYFKELAKVIFTNVRKIEAEFDFKQLIIMQKEIEKRKMMDEIQQRIDHFNNALNSFNQNTQQQQAVGTQQDGQGSSINYMPEFDDIEIDEDMLPDPEDLKVGMSKGGSTFTMNFGQNNGQLNQMIGGAFSANSAQLPMLQKSSHSYGGRDQQQTPKYGEQLMISGSQDKTQLEMSFPFRQTLSHGNNLNTNIPHSNDSLMQEEEEYEMKM